MVLESVSKTGGEDRVRDNFHVGRDSQDGSDCPGRDGTNLSRYLGTQVLASDSGLLQERFRPAIFRHRNARAVCSDVTLDAVNRRLTEALDSAVLHHLISGPGHLSVRDHRLVVLNEVTEILELKPSVVSEDRWELVKFLELELEPLDKSEWIKSLAKWMKKNPRSARDPTLYRILAVDCFDGSDPVEYVSNVTSELLRMPNSLRSHLRGVRNAYKELSEHPLSDLPGPEMALVVHWALLSLFSKCLEVRDDRSLYLLLGAKRNAEERLYANVEYCEDVRLVDETVVEKVGQIYKAAFDSDEDLKMVAELKVDKLVRRLEKK